MIASLRETMRNKITSEKIRRGETIRAASGSYRDIKCYPLGQYNVNITYSFVPKKGDNKVSVHFWGRKPWDLKNNADQINKYNLLNEKLSSLDTGKKYDLIYDFYDEVIVTVPTSSTPSISNSLDAVVHYKSGLGNGVISSKQLYKTMKSDESYKKMIEDLKKTIKGKITEEKIKKGETIKAADGSYRDIKCYPLGPYRVNISYSFVPKKGDNKVKLHFWGRKSWSFKNIEGQGFWFNLINKNVPSFIKDLIGGEKSFDVSYDFYEAIYIKY